MNWNRIFWPLLLAIVLALPPIIVALGAPFFFIYLEIMGTQIPKDVGFGIASAVALFGYPIVTSIASFSCSLRAKKVFMAEAVIMVILFTLVSGGALQSIVFGSKSFIPLLVLISLNAFGLVFGAGASFVWMCYKNKL